MLTTIPKQEIEDRIKAIEFDKKAPLSISKRLTSPHEITTDTKNWFESSNNYWERKSKDKFVFPLSIDKKSLSRALNIVDSLVKLFEYRGHIFKKDANSNNVILMSGREINISMRNVGKYQDNDDGSYRSRDFVMTDVLCVQIYEDTWHRKEWKDTPYSTLEDKLIRVVAYTELFAEYSREYHLQLEERWRKDAIIREQELEKKREAEREQEKIKQLIIDAEAFDKAQKVENYLLERKVYMERNNLYTDDEQKYYEWGIKQIQNINPLLVKKSCDPLQN
ncbi:hypothetical protein [Chryseobacterium sp. SIMBA_038]|uniref:hypothetical protein n=1 Tax=Chryseobacterium sp. SIMBA_038 TaxID=3085780 RepID=UPI00397A8D85